MNQPGKVANSARGQLNKENEYTGTGPPNLSRDKFSGANGDSRFGGPVPVYSFSLFS